MWESPTILTPVFWELLRSQSQVPGMLDLKHPAGNLPPGSLLFRFKLSEWPDLAFVGWQSLCAIAHIFRFRPSRKVPLIVVEFRLFAPRTNQRRTTYQKLRGYLL